jgi:hypothetical protein
MFTGLAAVVVVCAATAYAVAARQISSAPSYTGCLKNGKLDSIAVGDAPLAPCGSGSTQVRLGSGDVTSVGVGAGLTGGGDQGDVTIGADTSVLQSRVANACESNRGGPIDASISAIHADGTVTCNPDDTGGSDVIAGFWDGPEPLPVDITPHPIASLALPAGKYAITVTLDVESENPNVETASVCDVHAGADFDSTFATLGTQFHPGFEERFALQVVHDFAQAGDAVVSCSAITAGPTVARWSFLKVTATRVAGLSNGPLTLVPLSLRRSR